MKKQIFKKAVGGWWPCEEKVLISMLKDNYPVNFIADVLGRDRMGVHMKIKVMQRNENKKMEQAA